MTFPTALRTALRTGRPLRRPSTGRTVHTRHRPFASRLARAGVAMLGVVAALTLATPAAALASAPNPGSVAAFSVDRSNPDFVTFTLTADAKAGDCVAMRGGTLRVFRPDESGMIYLQWHQLSYTNHTKHGDSWHTDINLLGTGGSSYLVPTSINSPTMSNVRQVYEWTAYSIIFPVPDGFWDKINSVWWTIYC